MAYLDYPGLQHYDEKIKEYIEEVPAQPSGTYPDMTAGNAKQLESSLREVDRVPYNFRSAGGTLEIGDREYDEVHGGSVVWNQLCNSASVTVQSGHKYYMVKSGTASIGASDGTAITGLTSGTDMVTDLTAMFGSTIADYLYTLETATAGSGIAKLKSWGFFTKDYYPYHAPSMESVQVSAHKMVGFNAYNPETGKALVLSGYEYKIEGAYTGLTIDGETITPVDGLFTPTENGELVVAGGGSDTCIFIHWDNSRDGEYHPYEAHTYPLDDSLTLRGIPQLDSDNQLYYYGDIYKSDGSVQRNIVEVDLGSITYQYYSDGGYFHFNLPDRLADYKRGAPCYNVLCSKYEEQSWDSIDGGSVRDKTIHVLSVDPMTDISVRIYDSAYTDPATFKTAMSGVKMIYKKATPTTETADPFQSPQIVDNLGTEQYVDAGDRDFDMPVGHRTEYPVSLKDKIESAPNLPASDGIYVLKYENGQASYVLLESVSNE